MKSGSKAVPTKSKWQYYESMKFLLDFMSPAPTEGNLNVRSQDEETQEASYDIYDDENTFRSNNESDTDSVLDTTTRPQSQASTSSRAYSQASTPSQSQSQASSRHSNNASVARQFLTNSRFSRKRKTDNFNEELLDIQKKKVDLLEKEVNSSKEVESSDLQFFRSLLPYMDHLTLLDKLELRSSIQGLVLEKFKKAINEQRPPSVQSNQQLYLTREVHPQPQSQMFMFAQSQNSGHTVNEQQRVIGEDSFEETQFQQSSNRFIELLPPRSLQTSPVTENRSTYRMPFSSTGVEITTPSTISKSMYD